LLHFKRYSPVWLDENWGFDKYNCEWGFSVAAESTLQEAEN